MSSNKLLNQILLLSAMLALPVLGYLFDVGLNAIAPSADLDLNVTRILLWLTPLFQLLIILAGFFLFWIMYTSGGYNQWVCYFGIVLGLLMLYFPALLFVLPLPDSWYFITEYLVPGTFLYQSGAIVAGVGFLSLGLWKPPAEANELAAELEPVSKNETVET